MSNKQAPRLVNYFIDVLTYVVRAMRHPSEAPDYDSLRNKISHTLSIAESAAVADGVIPYDFDQARFAVCAFIDEAILATAWEGKKRWLNAPLQKVYYDTVNAGEEFFKRLQYLAPGLGMGEGVGEGVHPRFSAVGQTTLGQGRETPLNTEGMRADNYSQVMEVYALCLQLGFTGKYFHERDQIRLRSLRAQAVKVALANAKWLSPEVGCDNVSQARLTPTVYESHAPVRPQQISRYKSKVVIGLLLGVPLTILVCMYLVYNTILGITLDRFLQTALM